MSWLRYLDSSNWRRRHGFWSSIGDKFVCGQCLEDEALRATVKENAEASKCDYCGRKGRNGAKIAAPVDLILEQVYNGICLEYTDPVNELPYESREGGYQGNVIDGFDVLDEVGPISNNAGLLEDLTDGLSGTSWCEIDYFAARRDDALRQSWAEFKHSVKHRHRYFFQNTVDDDDVYRGAGEIAPHEALDTIAKVVTEADMIVRISGGTKYFRARVHKPAVRIKTASSLGPPPSELAKYANRMSPAGISMFYGAEDRKTAVDETLDPSRTDPAVLTTGAFVATRDLYLLDLASVECVPSLFDAERGDRRRELSFLYEFTRDLSKRIVKDGREHIEYVPTQIVTEYFRDQFVLAEGGKLDGIRYYSAQRKGGICVVLFFDNEGCTDQSDKPLTTEPFGLALDLKSIRHRRLNW
jgi:hypothetical protein